MLHQRAILLFLEIKFKAVHDNQTQTILKSEMIQDFNIDLYFWLCKFPTFLQPKK